jgi:hypothetical protein
MRPTGAGRPQKENLIAMARAAADQVLRRLGF